MRGYFDDGVPLGSHESDEAKIDSLGQSWAVISGHGNLDRAAQGLEAVWEQLVKKDSKGRVLLFTPPFDKTTHDPGYIKGYPPGVRENGGQYTHGSLWVPLAFARRGDGSRAVELLHLISPVEHAQTRDDVLRYRLEPYVVAADIYSLTGREGRGGWTWYTGSAGWMYRVWLEEILGFRLRGSTLTFSPCLPKDWSGFRLRYRHQTATYIIDVERAPDGTAGFVEVDGARQDGLEVRLQDDGQEHSIRVVVVSLW